MMYVCDEKLQDRELIELKWDIVNYVSVIAAVISNNGCNDHS